MTLPNDGHSPRAFHLDSENQGSGYRANPFSSWPSITMLCGALNEAQPQRIVRPCGDSCVSSVSRASTRILHYEGNLLRYKDCVPCLCHCQVYEIPSSLQSRSSVISPFDVCSHVRNMLQHHCVALQSPKGSLRIATVSLNEYSFIVPSKHRQYMIVLTIIPFDEEYFIARGLDSVGEYLHSGLLVRLLHSKTSSISSRAEWLRVSDRTHRSSL